MTNPVERPQDGLQVVPPILPMARAYPSLWS
jgi:hypothetical protein